MSSTMLSVTAPNYTEPSGYQLSTIARPTISKSDEVIIKVHAASINPIDVKAAAGMFKLMSKAEFPYKLGYDCAGVITEVGDAVTKFKVGDEVYTRLPESHRGAWSEYAHSPESLIAHKPQSLSFTDAASIPLAAVTALQALRKYRGSLSGKTVFVPAGLGGVGAYGIQLAKNVFHAGKVITTVSTAKVAKVPELLGEGVVDQIIDYTKDDPMKVIPRGSVDFVFDTTGSAMQYLSLVTPSTGRIVSISLTPSGDMLQETFGAESDGRVAVPWWVRLGLNLVDSVRRWRAWRWSVEYSYMFLEPNGKDLDTLRECVDQKQLRPIVGSTVPLQDIEKVKQACAQAYAGKGGLGKTVFEVVPS